MDSLLGTFFAFDCFGAFLLTLVGGHLALTTTKTGVRLVDHDVEDLRLASITFAFFI